QVTARFSGFRERVEDACDVVVERPDPGVDLAGGDAQVGHGGSVSCLAARPARAPAALPVRSVTSTGRDAGEGQVARLQTARFDAAGDAPGGEDPAEATMMAAMLGPLIIVLVLCVAMPVAVMVSGGVAAGVLGYLVKDAVDHDNAGSELLETNR